VQKLDLGRWQLKACTDTDCVTVKEIDHVHHHQQQILKRKKLGWVQWLMPAIPASWEVERKRIMVETPSHPRRWARWPTLVIPAT
jgi:hypothetical protein